MQIELSLLVTLILSNIFILKFFNPLVRVYFLAISLYSLLSLVIYNEKVDFHYVNNIYIHFFVSFFVSLLILKCTFGLSYNGIIRTRYSYDDYHNENLYVLIGISIFFIMGVLSFLFISMIYGVPILNIENRYKVSGYFSYVVFSLWIIYPLVFLYLKKNKIMIYTVTALFIFFCMGYRTPIVIIIAMFFIMNGVRPRFYINRKKIIIISTLMFLIIAVYPLLRFDDISVLEDLANYLEIPVYLVWMLPLFLATTEGAEVLTGIKSIILEQGIQMGSFTIGGMLTFLPNIELHSRRQLSIWLGRTNWEESTTTSTLIGQFMIEFGFTGIYILAISLSVFLFLSDRYFYKANKTFSLSLYCISFILLLLSIHTGLLDPVIIFAFFIYVFFVFLAQLKYRVR
ncbi:O-antigen ligase [Vibrio parahaemolyticus]|uniref:Oligosaccharide repeat unit polymerase n=1 Tax=Vibrio parahaemolyticus TaxID=670 RepID=A0A7M1WJJ4_VIBPH|nr:O-antigen polymerase [Vibrio parahaemolyticus]ATI46470.1 hypothetical protein CO725_12495 [Vibrio parahaemolyticus]EKK9972958.1 oligosaccharide repeat unit polymerase [Vibrio parahaemolyticus]ELI5388268.1 oligosaccharide repeat unit polymerase [Vibrio parahaemolyticus]MCC3855589.1 oligosaccharide repeat unit polymerase [Vibrio parahaemolyticus]MDF5091949.1 O-antigen ligase [Vibrio parahaemolyticus]